MNNKLIIIPAYNEEKRIRKVIKEIRRVDKKVDLVVVDDGSEDETYERARIKGVVVLRHCNNLGYGAALQTGFKYALKNEYDYVMQMDADGQHRAVYIREFFSKIEEGRWDVIVGSRFINKAGYKIPFMRKIGMGVFSWLASVITGKRITDPTSGFRVINRKVIKFYASNIYPTDFPDADVIIMLNFSGARIKEIPVMMRRSTKKTSMHNGIKPVYYIFKVFFSIFLTLFRERKKI